MKISTLTILIMTFFITACGGGGGGGGGSTTTPTTTLSGSATFTSYAPLQTGGLDYSNPVDLPIRGAVIEIRNSGGSTVATGNTDANGDFSIKVPENTTVTIILKAALGDPAAPSTTIVDNTAGKALYTMSGDIEVGSSSTTTDVGIHADSGWTGAAYTEPRTAGPFAILDVIYKAEQLLKSVDSGVDIPDLVVNWSVNNTTSDSMDLLIGDIKTSHFNQDGELYILGKEDLDTDEYDIAIIGHEWGHFFEDALSRSDTIGGNHASGEDLLDVTVAFGEGFGTALGSIINDDPEYIDTKGPQQGVTDIYTDLESDNIDDAATHGTGFLLDGHWAEQSIMELLWDIYDNDATDVDTDGVSLGFGPIYDVMVGGQKTTPAFTSIHTFLHHLKLNNSGSASAIEALANAENIYNSDEFHDAGLGGTGYKFYTSIPDDGNTVSTDMDGDTLQTWITLGTKNKFYNRMFIVLNITQTGNMTLTITPGTADDLYLSFPNVKPSGWIPVDALLPVPVTSGETVVFAVGSDQNPILNAIEVPFTINAAVSSTLLAPVGNN